jgi:hypothetical protein
VTGVRVGRQVAGGDDELSPEDRSHAWQGIDDLCLGGCGGVTYLLVDTLQAIVQGQDLSSEVGNDLGSDVLARQRGVLGFGGLQRGGGDGIGSANAAVGKPGRQPGPTAAADGGRSLVAGQQHQSTFVCMARLSCRSPLRLRR